MHPTPHLTLFGRQWSARVVLVLVLALCTTALFFLYREVSARTSRPTRAGPLVQVLLAGPAAELCFAAQSPYRVKAPGRLIPRAVAEGEPMTLVARLAADRIEVNGADVGEGPIRFESTGADEFLVGNAPVASVVIVCRSRCGALELSGELPMETYLARALFAEMPEGFHREALKAQLVAARSYAYAHILEGRRLFADDRSLVYPGGSNREAKAYALIEATAGEVLVHDDEVVTAYFHSTCGGRTLPVEQVFGGAPNAALVGGECPYCEHSPRHHWEVPLAREHVAHAFECEPDQIVSLSLDRDGEHVTATTEATTKTLTFDQLRRRYNASAGRAAIYSSRFRDLRVVDGEMRLAGSGFGHAVGLCQYGADGLARSGKNYREILLFYYPHTELRTLW